MGLFGLFYTAFGLGCKGAMGIKNSLEDNENRVKYRHDETNTYLDHNMTTRDLRTNHRMSTETKWNGEIWLRDCDTGHYIRNLTVERAEKKYQEEKAKAERGLSDRTHIQYGNIDYHNEKIPGYRYKDFKTGEIYVVRYLMLTDEEEKAMQKYGYYISLRCLYALINPHTKKAIRLTDRAIETLVGRGFTDIEIKKFNDKFIERFNKYINEPYTHFDITDRFQTGSFDSGHQDSTKEGNFIKDIREERKYRYGYATGNKLANSPKYLKLSYNPDYRYFICTMSRTNTHGVSCSKGDIVTCDKRGILKNDKDKVIGNINTFLRNYFEEITF